MTIPTCLYASLLVWDRYHTISFIFVASQPAASGFCHGGQLVDDDRRRRRRRHDLKLHALHALWSIFTASTEGWKPKVVGYRIMIVVLLLRYPILNPLLGVITDGRRIGVPPTWQKEKEDTPRQTINKDKIYKLNRSLRSILCTACGKVGPTEIGSEHFPYELSTYIQYAIYDCIYIIYYY